MLESIGLKGLDYEIYRALLLNPKWDMSDIQRDLGLSPEEVRSSFDRLTELALLHPASGAQPFIPTSPETGLLPMLQRVETELDERRAKLSRDRTEVAALTSEYSLRRMQAGVEGVEHIEGVEAVRVRLQELSQQATTEVRAFMPGRTLSEAALEAARPLDAQSLARGVRMYVVYLDTVRQVQPMVEYATWFASQGGQTRTVPSLPMRLIICDRAAAVIPVHPDASHEGAFVIHLESVVAALNDLFELVWERATPLGEPLSPDPDGPSDRDTALLKMLHDGLTDEGIGRKLGVSIRTVRRLMADLLKRLNAQSRFQAGAEAVRRGWI